MKKCSEVDGSEDVNASVDMVAETDGGDAGIDDKRQGLATKTLRGSCHLLLTGDEWNSPRR
jgi:hypothetical protein